MKILKLAPILVLAALSACASPDVSQYVIQSPAVAQAGKSQTTVEILEVSLPLYAQDLEIPFADPPGVIRTDGDVLWADTPSRAISLGLAEALSKLSGAVVAAEPWPLDEPADAKLDVRVKTLLASVDGTLQFSGQYFIVFESGRRPRSEWFDIRIPVTGRGAEDISRATGSAVNELAEMVSGQMR